MQLPRMAQLLLAFQLHFTIRTSGAASSLVFNGESQHNVLRHSVAVSDLNTTFGKKGSSLLSREIVSRGRIWSSIDDFTKEIFKLPSVLDWYIADVGGDGDPRSITLQGMFSCIDRGRSSSEPISWYVATSLSRVLKTEEGPDGFKRTVVGQASNDDITEQCLKGRYENPEDFTGRRITIHLDKHRGTGVRFIEPPRGGETSVVNDESVFDRLWKLRYSVDPPTVVVWDEMSGTGVVNGLPFDSGFKVWPTQDLVTERTLAYRVPMIPTAALTAHVGFRLQETRVARGQSRTSNLLLLLTVWSTGLALLLAVWIVGKTYSGTLVERSKEMRKEHVDTVVGGGSGWDAGEKALLFGHLAGVSILAAPVAQAIVEGIIDPRAAFEVTSGASVLYSDSRSALTGDFNNPIAGAVFTCTVWMTVRPLDSGFVAALAFSFVIIFIFALFIAMQVTKQSSETMRRSEHRYSGFSPWKLLGWLRLKRKSLPGRNTRKYIVFVRLRKDAYSRIGGDPTEDQVKEIALMGNETWRARANAYYYRRDTRHQNILTRQASRSKMHDWLRSLHGCGCVALFARVMMDDKLRFKATTAHTTPYGDAQPREWEYVRRGSRDCESIEWYRTNGQFPKDEALLLTRLGLLKYAKYIAEMKYCEDSDSCEYDKDGVKCILVVPQSREEARRIDVCFIDNSEGYPDIWKMDKGKLVYPCLDKYEAEEADVEWSGGRGGKYYTRYEAGNICIRYYLADKDDMVQFFSQ